MLSRKTVGCTRVEARDIFFLVYLIYFGKKQVHLVGTVLINVSTKKGFRGVRYVRNGKRKSSVENVLINYVYVIYVNFLTIIIIINAVCNVYINK